MLLQLPNEILDCVFELVASSTADSRAILPLIPTSRKISSAALRSAFLSICLLQCSLETVLHFTQFLKTKRTRRLLVSFKDLDSTPLDNTLVDLLDAVQLRDLVIYLCEGKRCEDFVVALERQSLLETLDFGSFTAAVSFDFADLCRFVARSRHLLCLSWEVVGVLAELPTDFAAHNTMNNEISDTEDRQQSKVTTLNITCPAITDEALLTLIDLVRPTLKSLKLTTTAVSTLLTPHGIETALSHLPSLETLILDLSTPPSDPSTPSSYPCESIIATLPRLRYLSLSSAHPLATISGLARCHNQLEELHIGSVNFVGAFEEKMLALSRTSRAFPSLKLLRVELDGRTISSEGGATSMESSLQELWAQRLVRFVLTRTRVTGGVQNRVLATGIAPVDAVVVSA